MCSACAHVVVVFARKSVVLPARRVPRRKGSVPLLKTSHSSEQMVSWTQQRTAHGHALAQAWTRPPSGRRCNQPSPQGRMPSNWPTLIEPSPMPANTRIPARSESTSPHLRVCTRTTRVVAGLIPREPAEVGLEASPSRQGNRRRGRARSSIREDYTRRSQNRPVNAA